MADSREFLIELSKRLTDQGKLIEGGWIGYRAIVIPPDAPAIQLEESRRAFFAGAQHLFSSVMSILEPGSEPTDRDLARITLIHHELEAFIAEFKRRHGVIVPTEH